MPSAVGGSWDCYAGLETPHQGAAAAAASGGCSGAACLGTFAAVGARHPLLRLRFAAVAPALVHLALPGVEVLLRLQCLRQVLHPVLDALTLNFAAAAAASASDAGAVAVVLQLLGT